MQLDRVLCSETTTGAEHPYQAVLMRDLKAQVEALKIEGPEGEPSAAGGQAVYEVFTRTEAAKFAHLSKVSRCNSWVWSSNEGFFFVVAERGGKAFDTTGGSGRQRRISSGKLLVDLRESMRL